MALIAVVAVIVGTWLLLLGTADIGRRLGLATFALATLVSAIYAALVAGSLWILGSGWQGWFGAGGMLVPYAVSMALVFVRR